MSDNPYAPPKALVVDHEPTLPTMVRPSQINLALWVAAIGYGVGMIVVLLSWDYYSKFQTVGAFIGGQFFSLVICAWLYYKIYVGRNWARIVLLVFSLIGMAMTVNRAVMDLLAAAPTIAKVQMILGLAVNLFVLWRLFLAPGRHWFRRPAGDCVA